MATASRARVRNNAIRAQYEARDSDREADKGDGRMFGLITRANGSVASLECFYCGGLSGDPEDITFRFCRPCNKLLDPDLFEVANFLIDEGGRL